MGEPLVIILPLQEMSQLLGRLLALNWPLGDISLHLGKKFDVPILIHILLIACRTATRLVLSASIAFLVLMIPRGISYIWFTVATEFTDTHRAIDTVVWWLQYVNHSINFFIYVLASKKFRFTS